MGKKNTHQTYDHQRMIKSHVAFMFHSTCFDHVMFEHDFLADHWDEGIVASSLPARTRCLRSSDVTTDLFHNGVMRKLGPKLIPSKSSGLINFNYLCSSMFIYVNSICSYGSSLLLQFVL